MSPDYPLLGPLSETEIERWYRLLNARLIYLYRERLQSWHDPRTVVVVPSLSLDQEVLSKIPGVHYYEERLLYYLILLQHPQTQVIFVTSQAVDPVIVDYMLNLLPGVPVSHARRRLVLLDAHDSTRRSLTEKILERPWLIRRIREAVAYPDTAYMECFNSTPLERELAVRLGIPLYALDPSLEYLGSKSFSREIFREANVPLPEGFEHLRDEHDVAQALADLKLQVPTLRRAVVKLNYAFSGEGNALFSYDGAPQEPKALAQWVAEVLPQRLHFEAEDMTYEEYMNKFREMGGIVEAFIEGKGKRSPSVQGLINPLRQGTIVSTHDQILGGPTGQVYLGARFPADPAYRLDLHELGRRVGEVLTAKGAMGRYAVDFVSVPQPDGTWQHYALEINLRKGGTTHPFMTLKFLTDGYYDLKTGEYISATGQPLYYYATDNLKKPEYQGLTPEDLMEIVVCEGLHFNAAAHEGVLFHLIDALSEYGKVGLVAIGPSYERAEALYHEAEAALDRYARNPRLCETKALEDDKPALTHFPPLWEG
ncbi:MAG: carboxylate-amine ligase [Chloroflexi bacterium]|nr:carboxylate-amine ligase [Chloroflexota bacterium]